MDNNDYSGNEGDLATIKEQIFTTKELLVYRNEIIFPDVFSQTILAMLKDCGAPVKGIYGRLYPDMTGYTWSITEEKSLPALKYVIKRNP